MCRCDKQDDHHNNADHGGDVDNYEAPINLEVDYVVIFEGSELFAVQDFSTQYFAKRSVSPRCQDRPHRT